MTIYVIYMAAILLIGGYLMGDSITPKQKTNCMLGAALFLILMMSLRYEIGFDYRSYESIYTTVKTISFGEIFATYKLEPTFYLFAKLVSLTGFGYQQFLFVFNIVVVALLMFTIHTHSKYWWISSVLYVALQFAGTNMNFLRQTLAMTVIFTAWGLLKKRKLWQFLLVVVFAGTIHVSALIMIPGALLMMLPFNAITLGTMSGLILLGYIFFTPLVQLGVTIFPKYATYIGDVIYASQNDFSFVAGPFIYCLLVLLFAKKLLAKDQSNSMLLFSALYTFAFSLLITRMFILERFSMYFFIFSLLLIPEVVAVCKDMHDALPAEEKESRRKKKELPGHITAIIILVFLSGWFFYWNATHGANKVYPYVSVFNPQDAIPNNNDYVDFLNARLLK